MKLKLAILEADKNYLSRIMSVLETKFSDKFELYAFSDQAQAMGVFASAKIDAFLADESFSVDPAQLPPSCAFAYLTSAPDIDSIRGCGAICKYQRADLICKQIIAIYAEKAESSTGYKINDMRAKLIIFVGFCGAGASSAAAACAVHFAKTGAKTLYLTTDPCGTSEAFFSADGQYTMSDIIYALKSGKSNLAMKLEACVRRSTDGVYFYAAPALALDMMELSVDDISHILSTLALACGYDYIVWDPGVSLSDPMLALYRKASALVVVSDGSGICTEKISRFHAALKMKEQGCDNPMADQMLLLFNKFSSKSEKPVQLSALHCIGGAPRFEHATTAQVLTELAKRQMFDELRK